MDSVTATRIKILLFAVQKLNEKYLGNQYQDYFKELNCTIRMIIDAFDDELNSERSGKVICESFISFYNLNENFESFCEWFENSEDGVKQPPDLFGCNKNPITYSFSDDDLPF
jgi:hypothetical protein